MSKSMVCAIAVVLLLGLVLSGCAKQVSQPGPGGPPPAGQTRYGQAPQGQVSVGPLAGKRIGVSLLNKQHVFYQDLERAMRDAAAKEGCELIIESAEFDSKLQDDQVDNFIVQKVDAMILCPADSASVVGAIEKANAAGIPVFTCDIAAHGGKVVAHIASDNLQGGRLAAEYLAKLLKGKGKVLVIDHPAVESVQLRTKGFDEVMAKYPGIKVVAKQPAEGQRAKARDVMENMLLAHPDLDGVFGINDDSALGALAACRAHKGAENIVIVGYDATPEAIGEILAGSQLKADVAQFPYKMGVTTITTIRRYFAGEKVPSFVPIPVEILDKPAFEKLKAEGRLKQINGQWTLVQG
ncbi:MAG: substrate-binding domain-containing protein [Armatimonadetes bacterium]|nr:substrate-binding domain-containing protein [Armatimonadota bacterium]